MSTQHTPGPWRWSGPDYEREHNPPEECASYGLTGSGDGDVLSGCGNCGNIFYNEANGRLIAAAPDLLVALKECSFRLATLVAASGDFSDVNAKALDTATAALKKADG